MQAVITTPNGKESRELTDAEMVALGYEPPINQKKLKALLKAKGIIASNSEVE